MFIWERQPTLSCIYGHGYFIKTKLEIYGIISKFSNFVLKTVHLNYLKAHKTTLQF